MDRKKGEGRRLTMTWDLPNFTSMKEVKISHTHRKRCMRKIVQWMSHTKWYLLIVTATTGSTTHTHTYTRATWRLGDNFCLVIVSIDSHQRVWDIALSLHFFSPPDVPTKSHLIGQLRRKDICQHSSIFGFRLLAFFGLRIHKNKRDFLVGGSLRPRIQAFKKRKKSGEIISDF